MTSWSGEMVWPRATALDLMLVTASSSWLRLISKSLPLAIVESGNSAAAAGAGLAGAAALVEAGCVAAETRSAANPAIARRRMRDTDIFFINRFADSNLDLQFDHLDIADV